MAGPEEVDWVARLNRQFEPLQRAGQHLARALEPLVKAWRQFEAARDRGDFRDLKYRLRLMMRIVRQIEDATGNPSHRKARAWLAVQHLTPKEIAPLLPYIIEWDDLRIPKRRGKPKGRTAAKTSKMVDELDKCIKRTGEKPTTAARRVLTDHGVRGDLKGRAGHLVRVWKKRAFKSR